MVGEQRVNLDPRARQDQRRVGLGVRAAALELAATLSRQRS